MARLKLPAHLRALNPHLVPGKGKAAPIKTGDGYHSDLERDSAWQWVPHVFAWALYEPFKLYFPGGSYTPDWFGEWRAGGLVVAELKGWNKNLRADRLKFKAAAAAHRWARFVWVTRDKDGTYTEEWHAG